MAEIIRIDKKTGEHEAEPNQLACMARIARHFGEDNADHVSTLLEHTNRVETDFAIYEVHNVANWCELCRGLCRYK